MKINSDFRFAGLLPDNYWKWAGFKIFGIWKVQQTSTLFEKRFRVSAFNRLFFKPQIHYNGRNQKRL